MRSCTIPIKRLVGDPEI